MLSLCKYGQCFCVGRDTDGTGDQSDGRLSAFG